MSYYLFKQEKPKRNKYRREGKRERERNRKIIIRGKKGNIFTPRPVQKLNCADGCNDFENGFYDNVY